MGLSQLLTSYYLFIFMHLISLSVSIKLVLLCEPYDDRKKIIVIIVV